jgi:hypothetical protein
VPNVRRPRSSTAWLVALVIAGCSTGPTTSAGVFAAQSAASSIAAATSTPATPITTPMPARWVAGDLPVPNGMKQCSADEGGLQNLRFAGFGTGLMGFGSCAHSASPGLVWISADRHSWQASAPATLAHADVYDLLVVDGLIIAVGQDVTDGFAAAAWTSPDGVSWTRSTGDLGCEIISTVTRLGSVFVAFGNHLPSAPEVEVPPGICEWVSDDGLDWKPVGLRNAVFPDDALVSSVAAGPGGLLAVGVVSGPSHSVGARWQSPDGRSWTRVARDAMNDWVSVDQAIAGGAGFVILGTDVRGNATLATSADGLLWTAAAAPGQGTLYGSPSLGSGSAGVVFGGFPDNGVASPATIWTSSDGSSWRRSPALPADLSYKSVAVAAGAFVVAASTPDGRAAIVTLEP